MKFVVHPERDADREELEAKRIHYPLVLETTTAAMVGRMLGVAVKVGVFEAMADGPKTASEIAATCTLGTRATGALLEALATTAYAHEADDQYELTDRGRRWFLGRGAGFADFAPLVLLEMDWQKDLEAFVKNDAAVKTRDSMTPEKWVIHERAQAGFWRLSGPDLVASVPLTPGARSMLDIGGGAVGQRSAAFCRLHPDLRAVVLEPPEAVEAAAALVLKGEALSDRVDIRAGDPNTFDLGESAYDLILFSSSPFQRFADGNQYASFIARCARALRPGGTLAVSDFFRTEQSDAGQLAALRGLFFEMTSPSGAFTLEQVEGWQRGAGLEPLSSVDTLPGFRAIQMARKPLQ